jgi:hypothetical protein
MDNVQKHTICKNVIICDKYILLPPLRKNVIKSLKQKKAHLSPYLIN